MKESIAIFKEAVQKGLRPFEAAKLGEMQANLVMSLELSLMFPHHWEHTMFDASHTGILYYYTY